MTIFEQIKHNYPQEYVELIKSAKGFRRYLSKKHWWRGGWHTVSNGEGGASAILASMMLRVVEFNFDYKAAFADYSRELCVRYTSNRSENANYPLNEEMLDEALWCDPTADTALQTEPDFVYTSVSEPALAGSPSGGAARRYGSSTVVAGVLPDPGMVPLSPPYMCEPLNLLTQYEREVLEVYSRVKSYNEAAEYLGRSYESVKTALYKARKKAKAWAKEHEDSNTFENAKQ